MRQFHEDFVKSRATDMHNLTHAQTVKVNEANDSNAPDVSVIETSYQNNAARMTNPNNAVINVVSASGTTSQKDVSASGITPKSLVPCPFLRRKNYCLKGSKIFLMLTHISISIFKLTNNNIIHLLFTDNLHIIFKVPQPL